MAAPVSYYAFSIATDYYNQTANNFCFLIMSIHGFFSTVATIAIYENYRSYLLYVLRIKRNLKVTLIQSKSMAETTYI
uniref:G_PROTEIN_RECEP_F1_2 domain-containing protein n=1 Tax=Caenorhabditis tropicalis TaxID=1561998 RepID=A0A1I7T3Z3_9PELO